MPPTVKKSRKRESNSPEQRWAKQRNFNKRRVSAAQATLTVLVKDPTITAGEAMELRVALKHLNTVLAMWDMRNVTSKKQYLNYTGGKV